MKQKGLRRVLLGLFSAVVYGAWPLFVALASLSLMSMHMKYYGIGPNPGANNGYLAMFVAPPLLAVVYGVAVVARLLLRRAVRSHGLTVLLAALLIAASGALAFGLHDWRWRDYPSEKPRDLSAFLQYYIGEVARRW